MRLHWISEILALLSLLGLWFRERRKFQRQVDIMNNRLSRLESIFSDFMKECEKTLSEFSVRISQMSLTPSPPSVATFLPGTSQEVRDFPFKASPAVSNVPPKIAGEMELAGPRAASRETRKAILRLKKEGAVARDIASRLGIPLGEIELVLSLREATTYPKRTKAGTTAG